MPVFYGAVTRQCAHWQRGSTKETNVIACQCKSTSGRCRRPVGPGVLSILFPKKEEPPFQWTWALAVTSQCPAFSSISACTKRDLQRKTAVAPKALSRHRFHQACPDSELHWASRKSRTRSESLRQRLPEYQDARRVGILDASACDSRVLGVVILLAPGSFKFNPPHVAHHWHDLESSPSNFKLLRRLGSSCPERA